MSDVPPDRLHSPDGQAGWFAFEPIGEDSPQSDDTWQPPPDGSVIRLMGEHTVPVPLWDRDGLMFGEPEELVRELGVSVGLARELQVWAGRWHAESRTPQHDADAAVLLGRLRAELGERWVVVYQR